MKIAQLVSDAYPVSPQSNVAIYSHAAWLVNGLIGLGHDVTLFASGDSKTRAKLEPSSLKALKKTGASADEIRNYTHLLNHKCYKQAEKFDLIHSHFTLISSFYSDLVKTPSVQSIHSPITTEQKSILKNFLTNRYISFSLAQRKQLPELNWIANIYHGVDMNIFSLNERPEKYFLYLGRITKEKGVHYAIEAAKNARVPLIIAGRSYSTESYWHEKIEKQIDGKIIRYIGELDFKKKVEYLKNATALLFPTQYDEAFGYVMIEAMACGTPVIGWRNGSVPEVVSDKKTGYIVNSIRDMASAIKAIDKISREETRKRAERYFSVEKMVSGYAKVYQRVIEEHQFKNNKKNASQI